MTLRRVLVTVVGHVDHGKTSLLDAIRQTNITATEAGAITQAIGASIVPISTIKKLCGPLLEKLKMELNLPGMLFIDTPGHAAFTNLRKRGGALADIAILVVDLNEGFMPQTEEALQILKGHKTPFVVAATKLDLTSGWRSHQSSLIQDINTQAPQTINDIEKKLYTLVAKLSEFGFESERFDRVNDFTKQIAIVPLISPTKEGIPELLMVITGLAQKFLENSLQYNPDAPAKGTILEVKEEKGLGTTVDAIIYDGTMKVNDLLVIAGLDKPVVTKIRALLEPEELAEMRAKKSKFKPVKQVYAATGVKISAPDLDKVLSGMPLAIATEKTLAKVSAELQKEVTEIAAETGTAGVVIKADNLGSLEALNFILKENQIPFSSASIGEINKKDLLKAEAMLEKNPFQALVIGFNVSVSQEAKEYAQAKGLKIITSLVIYRLLEDYQKMTEEMKKEIEQKQLSLLVRPCKLMLLKGYVFRQNNPAVVGIEILAGKLKSLDPLMNAEGKGLTAVKSLEKDQESLSWLNLGEQAALAMDGVTVGRQIKEGEILYTDIPEEDFRKLRELKKHLKKEEIDLMKEIAEIKRRQNPVWGV